MYNHEEARGLLQRRVMCMRLPESVHALLICRGHLPHPLNTLHPSRSFKVRLTGVLCVYHRDRYCVIEAWIAPRMAKCLDCVYQAMRHARSHVMLVPSKQWRVCSPHSVVAVNRRAAARAKQYTPVADDCAGAKSDARPRYAIWRHQRVVACALDV